MAKIKWKAPVDRQIDSEINEFRRFCQKKYRNVFPAKSTIDSISPTSSRTTGKFSDALESMQNTFHDFIQNVSVVPLITAITCWIETLVKDKHQCELSINRMMGLIDAELIGLKDENREVWTLKHMVALGHDPVIEAIRATSFAGSDAEEYVGFYIEFVNALSEKTLGYVPRAEDPDVVRTKTRKMPLNVFINICKNLKDRERLIAKLLYFGGRRTLEDVLSLQIQDVFAPTARVAPPAIPKRYPQHVSKDLFDFIGARKSGYVFLGRHGEKIHHTVPYRALKTVASKLSLDPSFSFKDFSEEI